MNVQYNMQYNSQYNIINQNMMPNNPNPNKLVLLSSYNLEKDESDIIKSFIFKAISSYDSYYDIAGSIQGDCNNKFGGNWIVSVGEKDKFNTAFKAMKNCAFNIGQYKIVITYIE